MRDVFKAKYGKGGDLVKLFKEANRTWRNEYAVRVLTDASGAFFTVVTEQEVESLGEWETRSQSIFSNPDFGKWFERMVVLVESGHREFYNIE